MTADPHTTEPDTNPEAGDDPITETPGEGDSSDAPVDNPSGSVVGTGVHPEDNQHPSLDPNLASRADNVDDVDEGPAADPTNP